MIDLNAQPVQTLRQEVTAIGAYLATQKGYTVPNSPEREAFISAYVIDQFEGAFQAAQRDMERMEATVASAKEEAITALSCLEAAQPVSMVAAGNALFAGTDISDEIDWEAPQETAEQYARRCGTPQEKLDISVGYEVERALDVDRGRETPRTPEQMVEIEKYQAELRAEIAAKPRVTLETMQEEQRKAHAERDAQLAQDRIEFVLATRKLMMELVDSCDNISRKNGHYLTTEDLSSLFNLACLDARDQ